MTQQAGPAQRLPAWRLALRSPKTRAPATRYSLNDVFACCACSVPCPDTTTVASGNGLFKAREKNASGVQASFERSRKYFEQSPQSGQIKMQARAAVGTIRRFSCMTRGHPSKGQFRRQPTETRSGSRAAARLTQCRCHHPARNAWPVVQRLAIGRKSKRMS